MKPEIDVHAWMGNVKWVMRKERQDQVRSGVYNAMIMRRSPKRRRSKQDMMPSERQAS